MIVNKMVPLRRLLIWVGKYVFWLSVWAVTAAIIFKYSGFDRWLRIPWLPLSLIGTAVSFFVGFKNNSAYDRMWEARKIWGAIVNSSRAWGITVKSFVSNQFTEHDLSSDELREIHRQLIYRHIAWLYALRSQLLVQRTWEHTAQAGDRGKRARLHQRNFGTGLIDDEITSEELHQFIPPEEFEQAISYQNTATQLIDRQSMQLQQLRSGNLIDDFRHVSMQKILGDLYIHQGKAERIKNFPLPRQYANSGSIFVGIFILLLPFGMMTEFSKLTHLGDHVVLWSIPFTVLVGWVFFMMESIGDYSEYPFQGMVTDIPMFAICRGIEIDLREMLGETDLPPAVEPKEGTLM